MFNNNNELPMFINQPSSFFETAMPEIKKQPVESNLMPQLESQLLEKIEKITQNNQITPPVNPFLPNFMEPMIPQIVNKNRQTDLSDLQSNNFVESTPTKTESIGKMEYNINDLFAKNKEIMSLEEKNKNVQPKQAPKISDNSIIDRSYNANNSQIMASDRRDPLELLKINYRSFPAWRTQFG